jgi:serine/threonine-protein kinase
MGVTEEIQAGVVLADRYRVRDRLGRGGMATVFLAEDCTLGRDVAIKRLHTEGTDVDRERFRREARIGASLMHPNLVTIFDTLSGPDGVLIVMEHVRGRPLSDLIGPEGMDPRRLLEILRPVGSALDYAHQRGVVHRDVKPANVLIAQDRRVKLVDLGTATAKHLTQITSENEVMGTLAYIAPERLSGDSVGEPPADVYSLAVLAFEALAGHQPNRHENPRDLLDEVLHEPTPDLVEAWPEAPPRLARVLMQGMHPRPERRPPTAGTLVRDIEAALAAPIGRVAPPIDPTEPMTPPTEYDRAPTRSPPQRLFGARRRPRWLVPAVLGACVLLGLGTWLAVSGGGGENGGGTPGAKRAAASREPRSSPAATPPATTSGAATPAPAATAPAAGVAAGSEGARLNEEGYSLIQQGRYEEAIPILRRAVASFPSGSTDLNYAYALFNLGHALRLAGRPQEAIPILERRLQIPNQTETVRTELDAARTAAGE